MRVAVIVRCFIEPVTIVNGDELKICRVADESEGCVTYKGV